MMCHRMKQEDQSILMMMRMKDFAKYSVRDKLRDKKKGSKRRVIHSASIILSSILIMSLVLLYFLLLSYYLFFAIDFLVKLKSSKENLILLLSASFLYSLHPHT